MSMPWGQRAGLAYLMGEEREVDIFFLIRRVERVDCDELEVVKVMGQREESSAWIH